MKSSIVILLLILATVALATPRSMTGTKGESVGAAVEEDRLNGTIQRHDKASSTLIVRKGKEDKTVIYNGATRWTRAYSKEKVDLGEFKEGARVICLGKFDAQGRLVATWIQLQPPTPK